MLVEVKLNNIAVQKNNIKKRFCNKKFCYDCLEKNFPLFWATRQNKDWKCPCCLNECNCLNCKKNSNKFKPELLKINSDIDIDETMTDISGAPIGPNKDIKLASFSLRPKIDIIPSIEYEAYFRSKEELIRVIKEEGGSLAQILDEKLKN